MKEIKVQKVFNLDLEVVKLLDNEKNKSELVNALLKKYFRGEIKDG